MLANLSDELSPGELRDRRRALRLTQAALAAALGVTANTIARWERGEQRIRNPERLRVALAGLEETTRVLAATAESGRVATPDNAPTERGSDRTRHNLPAPLTSFVGREHERAELHRLLGRVRLLTLTGPGGIGKTRLALEVATGALDEYPDGAWFVDLSSITESALVGPAVAAVLGVNETGGASLFEALKRAVRGRQLLLVLDNCEHLVAACATLSDGLLAAEPRIRILATSREPLLTSAETIWRVAPLTMPDAEPSVQLSEVTRFEAVSLFLQRAQSSDPAFVITDENVSEIVEVCRRLDGVPLAIELAAARVTFLTPADIVTRLDDRFALLSSGSRTAPPRQQSLAATIGWSCSLLTDAERLVFGRFGVFAGSPTLEAAEAICAGPGVASSEVMNLLERLVNKSLVVAEVGPGQQMRYRLLDTLRAYARQLLSASGEENAVRDRHASFFVEVARRSLYEAAPASWAERLNRNFDDLNAALSRLVEHGNVQDAQVLGAALSNVWRQRGLVTEGRSSMASLLALPGGAEATRARASLLLAAGYLALYQGDFGLASQQLEECLSVSRALGESRELVMASAYLADLDMARGDSTSARKRLQAGVEVSQRLGDRWAEATLLVRLAQVAEEEGDASEAEVLIQQALPILRAQGATRMVAMSLQVLAQAALARGEHAEARRLLEDSLATWSKVRGWRGVASVLLDLGRLAVMQRNEALAATFLADSLTTCRGIGDQLGIASGLEGFATLAARAGDHVRAVRLAGAASILRETAGVAPSHTDTDCLRSGLPVARRALSAAKYAAAWDSGRRMPMNEAIRIALRRSRGGSGWQLTAREREVIGLIARGCTNREIGVKLVIDKRTAEGYVSTVLRKLGLSSRAQIAVWAIENGLGAPRLDDGPMSRESVLTKPFT